MWLRTRHTAPGSEPLVGADDDLGTVKRVEVPRSNLLVEGLGFQQYAAQEELVRKVLMPLSPQTRGDNDENLPLAFSPSLRQEDASLDCLGKSYFVATIAPFDNGERKARRFIQGVLSGYVITHPSGYGNDHLLGIDFSGGRSTRKPQHRCP